MTAQPKNIDRNRFKTSNRAERRAHLQPQITLETPTSNPDQDRLNNIERLSDDKNRNRDFQPPAVGGVRSCNHDRTKSSS